MWRCGARRHATPGMFHSRLSIPAAAGRAPQYVRLVSAPATEEKELVPSSWIPEFLSVTRTIADKDFNRWTLVPVAFVSQMGIGLGYSWSVMNAPLTRELGVHAPSHESLALSSRLHASCFIPAAAPPPIHHSTLVHRLPRSLCVPYVSHTGRLCAPHLPIGALAMWQGCFQLSSVPWGQCTCCRAKCWKKLGHGSQVSL